MNYEPRGRVRILIDAMRAAAVERPVWTSTDVAKVLQTSTASVPAFVDPSIRHGVLFRKLENGGFRLPAEAVTRLRKFIAWMPA